MLHGIGFGDSSRGIESNSWRFGDGHIEDMFTYVTWFVLIIGMNVLPSECASVNVTATNLTSFNGQRILLISNTSGVKWKQAATYCRDQYAGRLAVVDNRQKIQLITTELKTLKANNQYNDTTVWLGAKSNETLDSWRLVNGTVIPTGQGLFEETGQEGNCLSLRQRLVEIPCNTRVGGYLCDLPKTQNSNDCTVEGSCLVLFNASDISWFEARTKCLEDGGDLASLLNLNQRTILLSNKSVIQIHVGGYRRPWWWMNDVDRGLKEVLAYNWIDNIQPYTSDSCLTTTSSGWQPIKCNDKTTYFICEDIPVAVGNEPTKHPNVLLIIIGCLAGGILLLIVVVTILVWCLRRAKKSKCDSEEFQYHGGISKQPSSTQQISTINTSVSNPDEYQQSIGVERNANPDSLHNCGFEEDNPVHCRRMRDQQVTAYATSSIESIINRGSEVLREEDAGRGDQKREGAALYGLKKRLSLLLRREYDENRDALPSAATTLQRNPDVIPMTSLNVSENVGNEVVRPPQSSEQMTQEHCKEHRNNDLRNSIYTYTEVQPRMKKDESLFIVQNEGYVAATINGSPNY